jgi:hypothetical protein
MSRYFTRDEAHALLPRVERLIRKALLVKSEAQAAEEELRTLNRRITMAGGSPIDHAPHLHAQGKRDSAMATLNDAVTQIHDTGCLVKDLDIGLVDFPTMYRGEEVYLCWRLGESEISFWHGVDEGFRGRKRIDEEFLADHSGNA